MIYAYYLDHLTGSVKGGAEVSQYSSKRDIDFKEKSMVRVVERPEISDDDIIVVMDSGTTVIVGVCDSVSTKAPYDLTVLQAENIFDRTIFTANESIISATGMEDFIARTISDQFIGGSDALFDKPYMTVTAQTHTQVNATVAGTVDSENGVYNFKTFLGNVLQYYGIMLDFDVGNGTLGVTVKKDSAAVLPIDTRYTDIEGLEETYSIKALARLSVKWKNTSTGTETLRTFYLQSDRTITENAASLTRVSGTAKSVYIEAGTEAEMLQEVRNNFTSNSYNHSMKMNIRKSSKLYAPSDLYVGRKIRVVSGKTGLISDSLISKAESSSGSEILGITMGTLPVTLIDKIRRL